MTQTKEKNMPNIFDGLDKLEDQVIREYIAMLEVVKMENVFKGYGTTIVNKSVKLMNGIGNVFGKNLRLTPQKEMRLEDYIQEKKSAMAHLDREQLDDMLMQVLSERGSYAFTSKDMVSSDVIQKVAQHMKLNENMTIAQKADSIHHRYLEKMLASMQEQLKKQTLHEAHATITQIEKNISELSQVEQEELRKVLNINELTGKEIRNVLMKAGTPALVMGTLSASGFGAFIALTTVVHAVFTTVLGVTVPFAVYTSATSALSFLLGPAGLAFVAGTAIWQVFRGNNKLKNEIMGQIIFGAVNAYGGHFTVEDQKLPSYEKDPTLIKLIEQRDEEYNELIKKNASLHQKVSLLAQSRKKYQEDIELYNTNIMNEAARRQQSEREISHLKNEQEAVSSQLQEVAMKLKQFEEQIIIKEENEEAIRLELEKAKNLNASYIKKLKGLQENIQYQDTIIKETEKAIDDKIKLIEETETKKLELEYEKLKYKEEIELKDQKIKQTEEIRRKEITEKWKIYYPKFEITSAAIRDAVGFSKKEVWKIEKALIELHTANDFKSVSIGKIKDNGVEYEHMKFSLPCGFPTRLLYRITNDSNKKVVIEKIYKHNERFYQ